MSDVINIVVLIIMLIGTVGFIRAVYGLFAWKGRRKIAFVQVAGIPIATLLLMLIVLGGSEQIAANSAQDTIEADEDQTTEIVETQPEEDPFIQLGQWCYQERMNEMFDRVITIVEYPDGSFFTVAAFRGAASTVDFRNAGQELRPRDDGGFTLVDRFGEFYTLSDDLEQLQIHDEDGLIGTAVAHVDGSTCYRPEGTAQEELRAEQEANACRNDVVCWADKHSAAASIRCEPLIERSANFTMEWTDRWLERKFSHMRWQDREAGVITFIGDRARFQNGFGAWQNVIYECYYDTENDVVLDIDVRPGRLN